VLPIPLPELLVSRENVADPLEQGDDRGYERPAEEEVDDPPAGPVEVELVDAQAAEEQGEENGDPPALGSDDWYRGRCRPGAVLQRNAAVGTRIGQVRYLLSAFTAIHERHGGPPFFRLQVRMVMPLFKTECYGNVNKNRFKPGNKDDGGMFSHSVARALRINVYFYFSPAARSGTLAGTGFLHCTCIRTTP
jgi:hypothetical protein